MDKRVYAKRLKRHYDELKWLFFELYNNDEAAFEKLLALMEEAAKARPRKLVSLDYKREADPAWYKSNQMLGYCLYVKPFAGNLQGVQSKLDYIQECGVNYLHLMPLLDTVDGRSDGGYAVADFRKVKPDLGTMEDLEALTNDCHSRGISCCLDFVMNHTSEDHEWAKRARAGEKEYQDYYFFYDDWTIPSEYEKYVPQVFPTTAPGNFTWLEDMQKFVLTSFYPYQWDLNYANPAVFNAMVDNMLFLANKGIDVIRVDAVPYIWKQLGTNCRNLPQIHSIVRMVRMICEIVCPGTLLLGEVVMAPEELAPYFGTVEKPECHMLYNANAMCTIWHTAASQDTRLLQHQLEVLGRLPKEYSFLNYIRCHDDIGWGLDYPYLSQFGMGEVSHKAFLNSWFTGDFYGSPALGEKYNDDPTLGDARMCGTTASLTGVESAFNSGDEAALKNSLNLDIMLHGLVYTMSGLPIIYYGDEIARFNDWSYHDDPLKADDSRYIHRGDFQWDKAESRNDPDSIQGTVYQALKKMESVRKEYDFFAADADFTVVPVFNPALLMLERRSETGKLTAMFNFSRADQSFTVFENSTDILSDESIPGGTDIILPPGSFRWLVSEI